jgi:predicted house-cleaning noncanonical NTP pyrophosphatase (MazG superfamily)
MTMRNMNAEEVKAELTATFTEDFRRYVEDGEPEESADNLTRLLRVIIQKNYAVSVDERWTRFAERVMDNFD